MLRCLLLLVVLVSEYFSLNINSLYICCMGCTSSSLPAQEPIFINAVISDVSSEDDTDITDDCRHRPVQLTAYRAKQQASSMMSDPKFKCRPQEEQLELQREFLNTTEEMRLCDPFSAGIAKAMQQQLLSDKLFVNLLELQAPDLKEQVVLATESVHSSPSRVK